MKILGVTGSSGSGKSSICKIIQNTHRAEVLDADKIVKELQDNKTRYYKKIVETFGKEILLDNKNINRKLLAEKIFTNRSEKAKIDKITFEYVVPEIKKRIEKLSKKNLEYIIVDAPILIEANMMNMFDKIIVVVAKRNTKVNRICKRDGISKDLALKRLMSQKSDRFYKSYADFVIINDDEEIVNKVKIILEKIEREKVRTK